MAARLSAHNGRSLRSSPNIFAMFAIAALAIVAALGAIALAGTKTGTALALLAVAGPCAAYGALMAPLVFPFSIFALLVPFDNLLSMPAFGTVTKLLAIVSGGAIVLWLLRTRRGVVPDRSVIGWTVFFLFSLVSVIWALDPSVSTDHLLTFFQLLVLYTAISFMPVQRRTLATLVTIVIVSGVLAGAYGAYVFHHGTQVSANGRLFLSNDANIVDPNHFAAALILPFSLALVAITTTRSFMARVFYTLAIVVIGGGLAVAGSRGGLLAIFAAFLYVFIRSRKRLLVGGLAVAGIGVALAAYGNVLARFSNATSTGGAGRADIWRVGVAAFKQHPWFGAGFSNFQVAFDQAFLNVSQTYYTHWHRAPHNVLISTGVELGIVGLAIFGLACWYQFRSLRDIGQGDQLYGLRTGIEAALIGLLIASMFLDVMTTKYVWLAFILCALTRNASLVPRKAITTP